MSSLISCIWSLPSLATTTLSRLLSLYDDGVKASFRSWPDNRQKVDESFDKLLWVWVVLFTVNFSLGGLR